MKIYANAVTLTKMVTQQYPMYEWRPSQYQSNIVGHLIIKSNWVARKKGSYFTVPKKYMINKPTLFRHNNRRQTSQITGRAKQAT